jgi:RNA polymerase sigma factor (sigma-70 family)
MATRQSGIVLERIRSLFNEGRIGTMTDEQLLERFAARSVDADQAVEAAELAFEVLVLRHGPMVLGVCRRVLRDPHEVEDAFQATFLILARRASSIRKPEVLGGWLGKVAHRVAARARALSVRRAALEPIRPVKSADDPATIVERDDLCTAVLDEVELLPEKYRLPVQICYIEGQTHDEAAQRLNWPVGTVRTRLAWARDRLRARLAGRGLVLPAGFVGTSLVSLKATAEVPASLVKATVEAATGRAVRAAAASLAANALRAMLMFQLKLALLAVLAAGSLAAVVLPLTRPQNEKASPTVAGPLSQPPNRRQGEPEPKAQNEPATARDVGTVFFRVVDGSNRQPLPGVTLKLWIDGKEVRQYVTDESGRMLIPLSQGSFDQLIVTARMKGMAPMKVHLWRSTVPELEIPRSYSLAMERGTSIGGKVSDEDGHPIEGATVTLYESDPQDRVRECLDLDALIARTDPEGRWRIDHIPAGFDLAHLRCTFSHPDFISPIDALIIQPSAKPEQLRSRTGMTVLRRGITVTGRVLDRGDHPIAAASVRLGDSHFSRPAVMTDADGRFQFRNAVAAETYLTVEATGHGPEARPVRLHDGLSPFELRLGPGRAIRGQVVDSQGRALAGAFIAVSRWTGPRQALAWRTQTDATGRFSWDAAPIGQVTLAAFKEGYRMADMTIEPTGQEAIFRLTPASRLRIRGTVTDAATGRPVEPFTVVPNVEPGGILLMDAVRAHRGGRYEFSAVNGQPYRIRIEARGYLPVTSPRFAHDAGDQVFDVRLKKGQWLEGVVRGREGAPLAGAEVILATGNGVHIEGGESYQRRHHPHLLTGPDGVFSFSPPDGPFRVIALHDRGYTEASAQQLAEEHGLTVQPWGRIEGTLRAGGHLLAHESVDASLNDEPGERGVLRIEHSSLAQTDEQGRFVMDRVPPGEARVYWQPDNAGARTTPVRYYQPAFLNVGPGETVRVDLVLEGGRPLTGRVAALDERGQPLDLAGSRASLGMKIPEIPYPPGLSEADRAEWFSQWRLTRAGTAYRHVRRGFGHSLKLEPDGSFRIDEVQPGAYEVHVRVKGFAELTRDLTITERAAGQGGEPVDLGTLTPNRPVRVRQD